MAKNAYRFWLLAAVLVLAGCTKSNKDESINLKMIYKAGDVQKIETETTTEGGPMKVNSIMLMEFKVDSVKADAYVFETKLLHITADTDMMGEKENYDSAKDYDKMTESEQEMHREFREYLENPLSIKISSKGKVIEPFHFKGYKEQKELADISTILIPFPDENVKVGSQWIRLKENALLNNTTETTYTVKSIDEDEVVIGISSKIGAVKSILAENKAEGDYTIDRKTGKLIKGAFSMPLQGGGGKMVYRVTTK